MMFARPGVGSTSAPVVAVSARAAQGMSSQRMIGEGRIQPGRVFDRVTNLDGVPDGYRAMNARQAIKVMMEF